jgi:hypothetical protein
MEIRGRIAQTLLRFGDRLTPYLPGRTPEEKRGCFMVLLPGMAGVLLTARALPDAQRQERILSAARSFYIKAFATEVEA